MTPQERAEQVAHTYYSLGPTNLIDLIAESLQDTRRAALLEAAQVAIIYGERARDEDLSGGYTSELIAQALDRLAQEG